MKKKKSVRLYFGADLTCSQHVSPLVNHHLCGRWHSERPGRKLSWSADLLPPQKHRGRGGDGDGRGGVLRCQESSTGLKTVAPAVSVTRMKPNCMLLFTAELSIKHLRGASSGMSLFPWWSGVFQCHAVSDHITFSDVCYHQRSEAESPPFVCRIPAGALHNCIFTLPRSIYTKVRQTMRECSGSGVYVSVCVCVGGMWNMSSTHRWITLEVLLSFWWLWGLWNRGMRWRNTLICGVCSVGQTCWPTLTGKTWNCFKWAKTSCGALKHTFKKNTAGEKNQSAQILTA